MTAEQCQQALAAGAEAVAVACQEMAAASALQGVTDWQDSHGVVCIGELGIGNTTAAATMVAALCLDLSPADVCGRGTGEATAGCVGVLAFALCGGSRTVQINLATCINQLKAVGARSDSANQAANLEPCQNADDLSCMPQPSWP
jgi:NaMN:DMB phosphoribosyltransferase